MEKSRVKTVVMLAFADAQVLDVVGPLQMLAGMLNVSLTWLLTAEGDGLESPDATQGQLGAEAEAALAELQQLRAGAIALADKLSQVERRMRQAMHKGG